MHGPHSRNRHHRYRSAYDDDFGFQRPRHMQTEIDDFMANMRNMERSMLSTSAVFGGGMGFPMMRTLIPPFPSLVMDMGSNSGGGSRGRWASESTMSQTVNGVTHAVHKRRDWEGNVHVTRTYPDGRKVVTVNGVEQPDPGHIASNRNNYLPPITPPPPYSATASAAMNYGGPSERPVIPPSRNTGAYDEATPTHPGSPKKRWWSRT